MEQGEEEEEQGEEEEEKEKAATAAAARQSSVMMADPDCALRRLHVVIITTPPRCLNTTRYANTWRRRCSRTDVSRAAGVSPQTPPTASIASVPATLAFVAGCWGRLQLRSRVRNGGVRPLMREVTEQSSSLGY